MARFQICAKVNGKLAVCTFDAGPLVWLSCEIGHEVERDTLPDAAANGGFMTIDVVNDNGNFHQTFPQGIRYYGED